MMCRVRRSTRRPTVRDPTADADQTRCFGCGTAIHKNGLQMTDHLTVADQISNVVCQQCGQRF